LERGIIFLSTSEFDVFVLSPDNITSKKGIMTERKIRVLVAKPGLDGHDRGAKVVARALRDAGMEVIYTGLRQTPEMIAESALQEDVDAVGLSILSGAHMALVPRILELLKANGQSQVQVYVGGIIPDEDTPRLLEMGVAGVYGPGTLTDDIIRDIRAANDKNLDGS
jgi:methylmalonyl-CoA mutase, C-terminal domain